MTQAEMIESINRLGGFCGKRDLPAMTREAMKQAYGIEQADLLILFGGSIPCGCDVAGQAVLNGCAKRFMIVGGEGHTTQSLRQKMKAAVEEIPTEGKTEAEMMAAYIKLRYGLSDILLETRSTNCGNNVTNALALLKDEGLDPSSMIIIQDATMQRRMQAGFERHWHKEGGLLVNFAAYQARVREAEGKIEFDPPEPWGMWDLERYLTLLMGEIPRLLDDENGYGPRGKGFIAHVEIPPDVLEAFARLKSYDSKLVREANPAYASIG